MKKIQKLGLGLLVALPLFGFAGFASSDTLPAIAGHAWLSSEASCFRPNGSGNTVHAGVANSCSGSRKLLIPATARWTGTTFYRAVSDLPSTGIRARPGCRAVVNTAANAFVNQTPVHSVPNTGVLLGSISVPSGGTQHFDCDIGSLNDLGGRLTQVSWAQN